VRVGKLFHMVTTSKTIRRPVAGDRARIEDMWERCSPATRYSRLHSPCPTLPVPYIDAVMCDPSASRVCVIGGQLVGLASLIVESEGVGDLGVIVENAWQRHGVGTLLVESLVAGAAGRDITVIKASVLAAQAHLADALRRLSGDTAITSAGPTVTVTVRLGSNSSGRRPGRQAHVVPAWFRAPSSATLGVSPQI